MATLMHLKAWPIMETGAPDSATSPGGNQLRVNQITDTMKQTIFHGHRESPTDFAAGDGNGGQQPVRYAFETVALLYDPARREAASVQFDKLARAGQRRARMVMVPAVGNTPLERCSGLLTSALDQQWGNLLVLESGIHFSADRRALRRLSKLLQHLPYLEWQGLILGASYQQIAPIQALPGVARIGAADQLCAWGVSGDYLPELLEASHQALVRGETGYAGWQSLFTRDCWLGMMPGFARMLSPAPGESLPEGKALPAA
ncbi:hypothetical protein FEM41_24185 [Jejubacter calystegiae]|uniref:Uncharacterized protein n=1 Tax=Jejubacter calystegiae TaxID=2579935 RepID=A0A4P8YRN2_9ENTR|nr:hypothetical protein [Jejubacter calystegiae]QCT22514.1 hypothetical protein FEM41_24185 [Jejubacter calystegiae]